MHPIVWTEGAFLSQQHFQYWQAWLLEQQTRLVEYTQPEPYGLVTCEIDQDSLRTQKFVIKSLIWRTVKGDWVVYEASHTGVLSLTLEDQEIQKVYLNIPKNRLCSGLSGYEGVGDQAAYEAEYIQIKDQYDENRQHEITIGIPKIRLSTRALEGELYESWPIAQCKRLVGSQYEIDKDFIPLCLNLSASMSMKAWLTEVMNLIEAKLSTLREILERSYEQDLKEQYALLSEKHFELKEMESHGTDHPRALYQLIAKLVMRLGLINHEVINIEPYKHLACQERFQHIKDLLNHQLNQQIETLPSFQLNKQAHAYPSLENIDPSYLQGYSWYLGIDFAHQPQESILKFSTQAKLGTIKTLEHMIASALPGIKLSHQLRSPKQIRPKEGYEYFKLDHEGQDWKHVKDERALMLYLPPALDNKMLTLDIVKD